MGRRLVIEHDASPLALLADAIIESQQRAVGELAYTLAGQVAGLRLQADAPPEVDSAGVIDSLVREYAAISGAIGPRLCFIAAEPVLRRHPELRVAAFEGLASGDDRPGADVLPERGLRSWFRR